jgi:hypothetical protein
MENQQVLPTRANILCSDYTLCLARLESFGLASYKTFPARLTHNFSKTFIVPGFSTLLKSS